MLWRLAPLSLLLALFAACGDSQDAPATPDGPASLPPAPTAEAAPVPTSPSEALSPVIAARAALAELSGRTPEEIEVVSVTSMDWPDTCLGAPARGEVCAQAITPGYEVVLSLDDNMFTYHTDQQTYVRLANEAAD